MHEPRPATAPHASTHAAAFSSPARALQAQPPAAIARMVSLAIAVMALATLVYACFASIDIVVSAQGRVIPTGRSKTVQPLEAGSVRHIAVRDGQRVKAGDVLVELDPTLAAADTVRLQRELWEAQADVPRLTALLQGRPRFDAPAGMPAGVAANQQAMLASRLAEQTARANYLDADIARRQAERNAIESNIEQLARSLPLVTRKHAMRQELANSGHIAEVALIDTQLELNTQSRELSLARSRLAEADAGLGAAVHQKALAAAEFKALTAAELGEASRKRDAAIQDLVKATQRENLQVLRAPIDGVVQQLAVTTVGGVVTAAQPLMTIVPEHGALEVEAQVLNRDVGVLRTGQRAANKIETFDFTRFGFIEGEVMWVGTDAVIDPKLGPIYPVRVRLDSNQTPYAVNGRPGTVTAGMTVTVDIKTGERKLIQYFLSPLMRMSQESLRER